jgi:ketosteroid isomerase-like protein
MAPAARSERIRRAFEAFGKRDTGPFLDLMAPDVVYRVIGTTTISGVHHGRDDIVARLFPPLAAALASPLVFTVRSMTADGDRVAVEASGTATLRSGAAYDNVYCFVFRFAGERVAEVSEYLDTALVTRALGVPAERQALLRVMDLNMWEMFREIIRLGRGSELVETPAFTMAASPHATFFHNMVLVRDAVDPQTLLGAVRDFYVRRQRPFSIWTRPHADGALDRALEARGFLPAVSMPAMALLADPGTRCEPPGLDIRPVTDDAGRRDYLEVTAEAYAVYQQPRVLTEDAFAALESVVGPHIQGFVGYVGGEAVAAAAVYLTHGVAGIGWVGVRAAHRGRRYAEAVTWAAVREGFRRGGALASLQASPMGRPVYERMGFITPSEYRVLVGTP